MTGRERLIKTFKGQKVDRVPISPFTWVNNVYEMFNHKPDIYDGIRFYPDDFNLAEKYVEYHDYFGFDVLFAPGWYWGGFIPPSAENWEVKVSKEGNQKKMMETTVIRTPDGDLSERVDIVKMTPYLNVLNKKEYLIKTKKDFEILSKFIPSPKFCDLKLIREAKKSVGDKGLVNPAFWGAYNSLSLFRNQEDMMMDPSSDEGFYREMMNFSVDWTMKQNSEAIKAGADSIELGANMATSMVGPEYFSKYVLEYENKLAKQIHKEGAFVVYHNCGDAELIMHLYNNLDIDVWGYITGPPFADVILDDVLKIIRPNMALRGNIDQVEFMVKATPDQVKEKVKELLEKVKPRENWILSTTDFFMNDVDYENIKAFAEAGLEYGKY